MSKHLVNIGIVILLGIAVFLGYQIYKQTRVSQVSQSQEASFPPTSGDQNMTESPKTQEVDIDTALKQFPTSDSSEEERKKFTDYMLSIGEKTDILTITSCNPTPQISTIKKGDNLKIVNQDNVDHKLNIYQKDISIQANTTTTVNVDWGPGGFGYVCDNSGRVRGIFYVTGK